jgi:mannose-6-phosphate isomerase-like protein (cupin superfamily)
MPTLERFQPRPVGDKPWGIELLVAHTPHYTGKVLLMNKGHCGGLQYHVEKDETFYLFSGIAQVECDPGDGLLETRRMEMGESYHVPPGAVHRVTAITDCVLFETSTPHFDDRVNVSHLYEGRID